MGVFRDCNENAEVLGYFQLSGFYLDFCVFNMGNWWCWRCYGHFCDGLYPGGGMGIFGLMVYTQGTLLYALSNG